jgi:hypothetical protein
MIPHPPPPHRTLHFPPSARAHTRAPSPLADDEKRHPMPLMSRKCGGCSLASWEGKKCEIKKCGVHTGDKRDKVVDFFLICVRGFDSCVCAR